MKCTNCSTELAEDAKICGACGTAVPSEPIAEEPFVTDAPVDATEAPVEVARSTEPAKEKGPSKVKLALACAASKIKPVVTPMVEKCRPFVQKNKLWIAGGTCLAILLINRFDLGLNGAWYALVADQVVRTALVFYRYHSAKWITSFKPKTSKAEAK